MNTIKLCGGASKPTYEVSQCTDHNVLNIDVYQKDSYAVDYYFTIPAQDMYQFLVEYQKQQGIL